MLPQWIAVAVSTCTLYTHEFTVRAHTVIRPPCVLSGVSRVHVHGVHGLTRLLPSEPIVQMLVIDYLIDYLFVFVEAVFVAPISEELGIAT